jgi:hypothetical protein
MFAEELSKRKIAIVVECTRPAWPNGEDKKKETRDSG